MWRGFYQLSVLMMVASIGAAEKPVVTFSPNWNWIFTTESITMTCNVRTSPAGNTVYTWTRDNREIHTGRTYVISSAAGRQEGSYQCKGSNTAVSDPAVLSISNGWVILQAPLYVHEGDDLTLRCHHYPGYTAGSSIFYKEDRIIRIWAPDPNFHMKNINLEASGKYTCVKDFGGNYRRDTTITVRELFTTPEIRAGQDLMEGDDMTLKCHTNVSPFKLQSDLLFAFYKDGEVVRGFGPSDQYGVAFSQLEHSGKYHCEVKTPNDRVKKWSRESNINILELFTPPEIQLSPNPMTEGDNMTLTCNTTLSVLRPATELQFAFYKDEVKIQEFSLSSQHGIIFAQMKDSGNYSCEARLSTKSLIKSAKELNVLVQELFSHPIIGMTPEEVTEGDRMTLICNTSLVGQPRTDPGLQFAFYKDSHMVRDFTSENEYDVLANQQEHSGNYVCIVRTSDNGVRKKSEELTVAIQANSLLLMVLPAALGALLLIVILLVVLYIYCQRRRSITKKEPMTEDAVKFTNYNEEPQITYADLDIHRSSQITTEFNEQESEITYTNIAQLTQNASLREENVKAVVYSAIKPEKRRTPASTPSMFDESENIYQNTSS